MNRIEQLIEKLCQEGVEWKEMWEVTAWDKKFNGLERYMQKKIINYPYVLANKFKELELERGNVRLLSTGNYIGWTTEKLAGKHLCQGEIVAIPWGGKANVKYYKGKFVTADNRIATSIDSNVLINKFLYYWMLVNTELIESFYRGAGIKHPSMKSVLTMKIPLPPLPVQQEIVTILDTFTALDASLQAELEARRKQYEHYRNQLLNFEGKEVEWKTLGEVCEFVRGPFGGAIKKNCFVASGYAIYEQQHAIYGNTDIRYFISDDKFKELKRFEVFPGDLIMSCSGTMGKIAIIPENAPKGVINQALLKLTVKNEISAKYLKYYFENTITQQMNDEARGGAIKNVASVDVLKKIKMPVPPLSEQERIVGILDQFDSLVNVELPAEIDARRKQYEYYREKLLTFEPK